MLEQKLREFANERDWDVFHTPKNLILALTGEVGELAEIFQWLTEDQSTKENISTRNLQMAKEELADILLYVIRIADKLGIDLEEAAVAKIRINEEKYPIDLSKGNATKYDRRNE